MTVDWLRRSAGMTLHCPDWRCPPARSGVTLPQLRRGTRPCLRAIDTVSLPCRDALPRMSRSHRPHMLRAASRAARRLAAEARPVPAMSKAVPWSGLVRTNGRPRVMLTPSSSPRYLTGISPWS